MCMRDSMLSSCPFPCTRTGRGLTHFHTSSLQTDPSWGVEGRCAVGQKLVPTSSHQVCECVSDCVCLCVCERERERALNSSTDAETDTRNTEHKRSRKNQREQKWLQSINQSIDQPVSQSVINLLVSNITNKIKQMTREQQWMSGSLDLVRKCVNSNL